MNNVQIRCMHNMHVMYLEQVHHRVEKSIPYDNVRQALKVMQVIVQT